jgi:creatinine amidohydrolase
MPVRLWNQLTTIDFLDLDREQTLVLMPLGATEQHGPHLPVGTDYFLVEEILRRLKSRLDDLEVIILPTLWCTKSNEHVAFAGSLYLQAETMMAVIHDITAAISRSGFKRLVMMNWHGGNSDLLGALARDIRQRHRLLTFLIDIVYIFMGPAYEQTGAVKNIDIHAGRYETGMMLAAYPHLVKPGSYEDIGSDLTRGRVANSFGGYKLLIPEGGPVRLGWETIDLTSDGVIGNPAGANAEEGEQDLEAMVERVETMLREIAKFEFGS